MKQTPTALEFLNEAQSNPTKGWREHKAMIEFAKMHVEAALKAASENACHDIEIDWIDPYDYSAGYNGIRGNIDKESILNAYSLRNIR